MKTKVLKKHVGKSEEIDGNIYFREEDDTAASLYAMLTQVTANQYIMACFEDGNRFLDPQSKIKTVEGWHLFNGELTILNRGGE